MKNLISTEFLGKLRIGQKQTLNIFSQIRKPLKYIAVEIKIFFFIK